MKNLKIRFTFTEDCLGTASADKEIHSRFIASNAPDAPSREEEIAAVGVEEVEERSMTVFPRDEEGNPIFWDYQIKGFFKDSCSALQRMKGEEIAKESCKLKAYKKIIDGAIFVFPRKIRINLAGDIGDLQRPLRGQTADAVIDALRKKAADLEAKLKEAPVTVTPASHMNVSEREQATLNYGLAKREAQIYKQLYYDLIDKVIAMAKPDTEPDGIPF